MTVTFTSALAYASLENINAKQAEVLDKIEEIEPCSNRQIAKALGWEINRVTGRVTELRQKGYIKMAGVGRNDIGRLEKLWETVKEEA